MGVIEPYKTTPALFAAWRERCLEADGSFLFEGKTLWTADNLNTVVGGVFGKPQIGDGSFVAHLHARFNFNEYSEVWLLLCELLALHYCPDFDTKRNELCFQHTINSQWDNSDEIRQKSVLIKKTRGAFVFEKHYNKLDRFGVGYYASLALKYKKDEKVRRLINGLSQGKPQWEDAENLLHNENIIDELYQSEVDGAAEEYPTPHALAVRHGLCPNSHTSLALKIRRQKFLDYFKVEYPDAYHGGRTESENIFSLNNAFLDANPDARLCTYWGSELVNFYNPKLLEKYPWIKQKNHAKATIPTKILEKQGDEKMEDKIEEYMKLLKQFYQIIFQGPPGTGKTHAAKAVAKRLFGKGAPGDRCKIIQFHPSYNYEDFVRGIQVATTDDGQVVYRTVNRVLATMAETAAGDPDNDYVLIIDEINRANVAAVLGELIYALEYRGKSVEIPYEYEGESTITLPKNLYIIGTMNTADRTIGQIDYAVRRRFAFISLPPEREIVRKKSGAIKAVALFDLVAKLFAPGGEYLSPDYDADDVAIGHSYFLAEDNAELKMKMKYQVLPILNEYVKDGVLKAEAKEKIKEIFPNE